MSGNKEGWIEWTSGPRPVSADTRVICKLRNGTIMRPAKAKGRHWMHLAHSSPHFGEYDIIAYRVAGSPSPDALRAASQRGEQSR